MDFQTIELYLEGAIWMMVAGSDRETNFLAQAITAEMSFDLKLHAFSSLYKLRFPNDGADDECRELIKDLFQIQELRNQVIHAAWNYSPKFKAFTRMKASAKAKHGLRRTLSTVTPAKLSQVQERIEEVGNRFGMFAMKHIQERLKC